jgi:cytochrome b561
MIRNTNERYGSVAKFLHWLIALLVVIMLCAGVSFNYLPAGRVFDALMFVHKSTGVTILILIVLRLLWRFTNPTPRFPSTTPFWQKRAARIVHILFYLLLIAMPLTGIIMTLSAGYRVPLWGICTVHLSAFGPNKPLAMLMAAWHRTLAWTIAIFIVIHVLAAIKHHFYDKDGVLTRMLPGDQNNETTR